ncbi:hypothetical protein ITX31_01110 [Arthrobacter gandavensis]|uniref:hypothetical protein n=1 Tax=Arthrobacter gandavensis TaxID=169960 RepID=UPI0018903A71|nr:hypothetical protein [Arthrobacter gandavensis]MBF4992711.1 hypothetical protein [Arthrobacter gandavensis]
MHNKPNRLFIGLLLALSLAAAALVLSIPGLFGSPGPGQVWLAAVLGVLTAGLGTAVLLVRPQRRGNGV